MAHNVSCVGRLLSKVTALLGYTVPLGAGEPEGASDPLLRENAGERMPVLLHRLL